MKMKKKRVKKVLFVVRVVVVVARVPFSSTRVKR